MLGILVIRRFARITCHAAERGYAGNATRVALVLGPVIYVIGYNAMYYLSAQNSKAGNHLSAIGIGEVSG